MYADIVILLSSILLKYPLAHKIKRIYIYKCFQYTLILTTIFTYSCFISRELARSQSHSLTLIKLWKQKWVCTVHIHVCVRMSKILLFNTSIVHVLCVGVYKCSESSVRFLKNSNFLTMLPILMQQFWKFF